MNLNREKHNYLQVICRHMTVGDTLDQSNVKTGQNSEQPMYLFNGFRVTSSTIEQYPEVIQPSCKTAYLLHGSRIISNSILQLGNLIICCCQLLPQLIPGLFLLIQLCLQMLDDLAQLHSTGMMSVWLVLHGRAAGNIILIGGISGLMSTGHAVSGSLS